MGLETREQLERLLAHPLFSQSKRYPAFLRFVVEQTDVGNIAVLKERTIGIEVFGRDADYDVSADPVVRVTAAEVRKRLAQYYYDSSRSRELRIELPTGTYVATFSPPPDILALPPEAPLQAPLPASPQVSPAQKKSVRSFSTLELASAAIVILIVGAILGAALSLLLHAVPRSTSTQKFWKPLLADHLPISICVGAPKETPGYTQEVDSVRTSRLGIPNKPAGEESISDHYRETGLLQSSDVIALGRIASNFAGTSYRILDASETDYSLLQEGPSIFVGGVDNKWTMRLTQALPYRLDWNSVSRVVQIVDTQPGNSQHWSLATDALYSTLHEDFALIARYRDPTTGRFAVIVAGLGADGTEAASLLLSNAIFTDRLLDGAPKNWESMNIEAIVSTTIIHGEAGPPRLLAETFW